MLTLKEVDTAVRENSLTMLGNDHLNSRYVTALNMLKVLAPGMSPGYLRLRPARPSSIAPKERPEPIGAEMDVRK